MDFIVATSSINRYGFRLDLSGAKLDGFLKNPVLLYGHDRNELPIGRWENLRIEGDRMLATAVFDEQDEFALKVKGKVERLILNAASVRFDPIRISDNTEDLMPGQSRATVKEWELLEISIVDIPGDRDSVRLSAGKDVDVIPMLSARKEPFLTNYNKMEKIISALGLAPGATEEQAVAAIVALQAARVESLLAVGAQKGIVTNENRAQYERLAKADFEAVQLLFNSTKAQVIPTGESTDPKTEEVSLTALIRTLAGSQKADNDDRENWSFDDWGKKDSAGLLKMKTEDPEKYRALALAKASTSKV